MGQHEVFFSLSIFPKDLVFASINLNLLGPMSSPCDGFNGDVSSTVTTVEDDGAVFSGEEEEEWSGENLLCFYFVKQFAYDDPEIKAKIDEADNEIYQCNSDRIHIANRLKSKRAERSSLVASMENLNRLSEIKMEIKLLDVQMACVLDLRDKAFERIKFLRIQRDKENAAFFENRLVINKAIDLAASGNVRDLEKLANSEVDKFMSHWNNDKTFRDDYKKRILPSFNELVRDPEGNVETENVNETTRKEAMRLERISSEEESDDAINIDEETLKEKKREENLEKGKLAMERKRKIQEKAIAKAAIRVKKEAEKELKELEKRAEKKKKKKADAFNSSSLDVDRTTETVAKTAEPKQRSFRYKHHIKGNENVPKAILKRRKAYKLWVWTVFSAALVFPLALLIVFSHVR